MKSVVRLGRCCRWLYGIICVILVLLVVLELNIYVQQMTTNMKLTRSYGMYHREILKTNRTPNTITHKSPPTEWQKGFVSMRKNQNVNSNIFRRNQRIESTIDMVIKGVKGEQDGGSVYCQGNLEIYNLDIVLMRNVILDTKQQYSKPNGGETIKEVMGQAESAEDVTLKPGFFRIPCTSLPVPKFSTRSYFRKWYPAVVADTSVERGNQSTTNSNFTVFINRGDYANLYWTLIELYNTYSTIKLFNKDPKTTTVVLVDAHPIGKLENLWTLLFGNVMRVRSMRGHIFIKEMAWVIPISASPMGQAISTLPFIDNFKSAMYEAVGMTPQGSQCTKGRDHTVITLILRHDYVAHPRNPTGNVKRKMSNEKELIAYLETKYPGGRLRAVQIDKYPIEEQIRIIFRTSVLLGVHGAGLAHALLLRPGSTLFEMFPSTYKNSPNPHFQQLALWGGSIYISWYSDDQPTPKLEWLRIPPDVVEDTINQSLDRMCNSTTI